MSDLVTDRPAPLQEEAVQHQAEPGGGHQPDDGPGHPARAEAAVCGWLKSVSPEDRALELFDGSRTRRFAFGEAVASAALRLRPGSAVEIRFAETGDAVASVCAVDVLGEAMAGATEKAAERRFLDFRDQAFHDRLALRHELWLALSNLLARRGFLHIETPILSHPSTSGAQEFVTTSQKTGQTYALPQSPQVYGHLLAIGGVRRYFQWGRCFRDEDLRSNRQPEFTQLHLEMAFADREALKEVVEAIVRLAFELAGRAFTAPVLLTFDEAMAQFGSDKPDLRFACDFRQIPVRLDDSDEGLFIAALPKGLRLSRDIVEKVAALAEKRKIRFVSSCRSQALRHAALPLVCDPETLRARVMADDRSIDGDDVLLFSGDWRQHLRISRALYKLFKEEARTESEADSLVWVTGFPMFEPDPDQKGRLKCACHPFLQPEDESAFAGATRNAEYLALRGQALDLVVNGEELGSGSMLIGDKAIQTRMFHVIGQSKAEVRQHYGTIVDALQAGAPPIGGFGLGFDRLVAGLAGCAHIRDVMAFPKSKQGICMAFGSSDDT